MDHMRTLREPKEKTGAKLNSNHTQSDSIKELKCLLECVCFHDWWLSGKFHAWIRRGWVCGNNCKEVQSWTSVLIWYWQLDEGNQSELVSQRRKIGKWSTEKILSQSSLIQNYQTWDYVNPH